MKKTDSVKQLRNHLTALFDRRYDGTSGMQYAQRQGFIDGYMEAMRDLAVVNDGELLQIVAQERQMAASRADHRPLQSVAPAPIHRFA